jgi:hypothetical protein
MKKPHDLCHNAEHPDGASFAIAVCDCGAEWDMTCDGDGVIIYTPRNPLAQVPCPIGMSWM